MEIEMKVPSLTFSVYREHYEHFHSKEASVDMTIFNYQHFIYSCTYTIHQTAIVKTQTSGARFPTKYMKTDDIVANLLINIKINVEISKQQICLVHVYK